MSFPSEKERALAGAIVLMNVLRDGRDDMILASQEARIMSALRMMGITISVDELRIMKPFGLRRAASELLIDVFAPEERVMGS